MSYKISKSNLLVSKGSSKITQIFQEFYSLEKIDYLEYLLNLLIFC